MSLKLKNNTIDKRQQTSLFQVPNIFIERGAMKPDDKEPKGSEKNRQPKEVIEIGRAHV